MLCVYVYKYRGRLYVRVYTYIALYNHTLLPLFIIITDSILDLIPSFLILAILEIFLLQFR